MLPAIRFNMEGSSNNLNNTAFALAYDDSVILNCVRNRKKNSELPNCPVCSCTIRQGELENHLCLEIERLTKLSSGGNKRKLSANNNSSVGIAMPGSSTDIAEEEVDVSGGTGSDIYQRVHANRVRRLRTRSRRASPGAQSGSCPVCEARLPVWRLQRHALRCLRRTGAHVDDDVPDTSSEEGSIDVENDEPRAAEGAGDGGGGFGAEYRWCGEWRVRATALAEAGPRAAHQRRRASVDTALVVDGDEDTELYGPPQYSPLNIAPQSDAATDGSQNDEDDRRIIDGYSTVGSDQDLSGEAKKYNDLVEASAETRIQALKARITELETRQNSGVEAKCLICLDPYTSPAVSIQCWHVYCEVCWLESLRTKKICPQCNAITTTQHLRRIYM